jgi:hypothetical protein
MLEESLNTFIGEWLGWLALALLVGFGAMVIWARR